MAQTRDDVVNHASLMRELARLVSYTIFEQENAQQTHLRLAAKASEAANVVDALTSLQVDGVTRAEVADLTTHLVGATQASATKARAAADINTAALQAAKAIHGRHGGIAEAVAASPAPMASKAFYPN